MIPRWRKRNRIETKANSRGLRIDPSGDSFLFSYGSSQAVYTDLLGPASITSIGSFDGSTPLVTGDAYGFSWSSALPGPRVFVVPDGYVSNDAIYGTMTFQSQSLAGMGLAEGTTVWTINSGDTISLSIIPEPSAGLLAILGLMAAWRRQR